MSLKSFDGLVGELKVIARQKGLDINKANAAKSALVGLYDLGFYQKSYEKDIETCPWTYNPKRVRHRYYPYILEWTRLFI